MTAVISVEGLTVRYGRRTAVDGLDLTVEAGTIHALVGPNGAGKTTAFDCVVGLRSPTTGTVQVFGLDPVRHRRQVHRQTGVVLQDNSLYKRIGVAEAVQLFASFMPASRPVAEVLADVQLEDRARDRYESLSGGQRRRLLLALAVVGMPSLLVLDEPTSGLDPHASEVVWRLLGKERERGATIFLSTHNLVEAQQRCDHVSIVDNGRLVTSGRPDALMASEGIQVQVSVPVAGVSGLPAALGSTPGVVFSSTIGDRVVALGDSATFVDSVTAELERLGVLRNQVTIRPATFEDYYLVRTGHAYDAKEEA